jgi:hypothetical protein
VGCAVAAQPFLAISEQNAARFESHRHFVGAPKTKPGWFTTPLKKPPECLKMHHLSY